MPTPLVTERPRRAFSRKKDPKTNEEILGGARVFDVTGVADVAASEAALLAAFPNADNGQPHPQYTGAVATDRSCSQVSAAPFFTWTVNYGSDTGDNPQQLLTPPEIKYEPYIYTEVHDKDLDGVPFVNTGNFPFDQGMPIEKIGVILTISRWETSYPIAVNMAYGCRVNSGTFSWADGKSVSDGQAKCLGVFQGERNTNSLHVRVSYKFDLREEGHQLNVVDQGAIGYFISPVDGAVTTGMFVYGTSTGPAPTGPVALNGGGVPIRTGIKVAPAFPMDATPQDPFIATPASPSAALLNSSLSNANIKILTFRRAKSISFAGLNL